MADDPQRPRCAETTKKGTPCTLPALAGDTLCRVHRYKDQAIPPGRPPEERRCIGTASGGYSRPERDGERCDQWAMRGQKVCADHGGKARQNRVAAARRLTEVKLQSKAAALVGAPVENPLTELAALAGRARAWMELMQSRVEGLLAAAEAAEGQEGGGTKGTASGGIRYRGGTGEQIRAEVQLYERAMDRLGKFLADYGRLNIDERLSRIEESKAEVILKAIDAALAHAGVAGAQATEAKKVAARHLRAV